MKVVKTTAEEERAHRKHERQRQLNAHHRFVKHRDAASRRARIATQHGGRISADDIPRRRQRAQYAESDGEERDEDEDPEIAATRTVLHDGVGKLVGELRMSLDYYGAQEGVPAVDRIVLCGPGSTIPGLADQLEDALGYRVDELRPAALAGLEDHEAARLTVSYGLALEEATA